MFVVACAGWAGAKDGGREGRKGWDEGDEDWGDALVRWLVGRFDMSQGARRVTPEVFQVGSTGIGYEVVIVKLSR